MSIMRLYNFYELLYMKQSTKIIQKQNLKLLKQIKVAKTLNVDVAFLTPTVDCNKTTTIKR